MLKKNCRGGVGSAVSVVTSCLFLIVTGWAILNRQFIFDQWTVYNYRPSSEVVIIANHSGMSDKGRFNFYTSQPAINSATDFNVNCQRQELKSAILGCYSGGKIYIYNVQNSQLDGIKEVTASHETLHAIWQRMSDRDRKSVGALLEAEYIKLNDESLKERMAYYDRNEPNEHLNELHSIIGTEIKSIDPKLENYYSTYFSNRSKVVNLYVGYETVFSEQAAQADTLLTELNALKDELDSLTASYNNETHSIDADYTALKNRSNSIDLTSVYEVNSYNAVVESLRVRIDLLNVKRTDIIAKQDTYNTKVTQHNALVVSTNELTKSLDSTLESAPSL